MKRLSLISLLWLVAAFFGGRTSMLRKVKEAEEDRRDLKVSMLESLGKVYSEEFAENLVQTLLEEGVEFPTTSRNLNSVIDLNQLVWLHVPTREEPYAIFALSPNHSLRVDLTPAGVDAIVSRQGWFIEDIGIKSVTVAKYNNGDVAAAFRVRHDRETGKHSWFLYE